MPLDDDNPFRPIVRRAKAGTEIAPGVWSDPLSERRHDYGGELSGFEAAIAQTKSIVDAVTGGGSGDIPQQSLDAIWDAACDVCAHIVESYEADISSKDRASISRAIRKMKKDR